MSTPPPVANWFQNGFHSFLRPFLKRHFHTVAVHSESSDLLSEIGPGPLIVFGNHPSWWDPLIAHFLCRRVFAPRQFYAPIDAAALEQYQVFRKLGFFGIELNSKRGAAEFLKISTTILQAPRTSLWLTPEGRFADSRDRDATLMPGLSHLCSRMPAGGMAVAMALEYVFWEERLPECLVRFGPVIHCDQHADLDKPAWHALLTDSLRGTQDLLATDSVARSSAPFTPLLSGKRGAGSSYDSFRRLRATLTGGRFRAEHGRKFH
ncbi:lysophospholipid acyltransferase family protein [Planctomycetaceae bacterium SH139]